MLLLTLGLCLSSHLEGSQATSEEATVKTTQQDNSPAPASAADTTPHPTSAADTTLHPASATGAPVIAAYFTEWSIYTSGYSVDQIPAQWLTHIIYAFAQIEDGQLAVFDPHAALEFIPAHGSATTAAGNFAQLQELKKANPHLKLLIATGGWTLSSAFSDVASNAESRQRFATSAVAFIRKHGFDGIDLDWEYPVGGGNPDNVNRPEDKHNYTLLVRLLRKELNAAAHLDGRPYLLTVATPASEQLLDNFEIHALAGQVDWFNLMAYDYSGAWEPHTGHLAPLDSAHGKPSVRNTVRLYRERGVPLEKIVLGVPLYSRGWAGVPPMRHGLYQPASGPSQNQGEPGLLEYRELLAHLNATPLQWAVQYDSEASAAFAYNPDLDAGTFYTLEDARTVRTKTLWARHIGLRGIMLWPLSGDLRNANAPGSLLRIIHQALYGSGQTDGENNGSGQTNANKHSHSEHSGSGQTNNGQSASQQTNGEQQNNSAQTNKSQSGSVQTSSDRSHSRQTDSRQADNQQETGSQAPRLKKRPHPR